MEYSTIVVFEPVYTHWASSPSKPGSQVTTTSHTALSSDPCPLTDRIRQRPGRSWPAVHTRTPRRLLSPPRDPGLPPDLWLRSGGIRWSGADRGVPCPRCGLQEAFSAAERTFGACLRGEGVCGRCRRRCSGNGVGVRLWRISRGCALGIGLRLGCPRRLAASCRGGLSGLGNRSAGSGVS